MISSRKDAKAQRYFSNAGAKIISLCQALRFCAGYGKIDLAGKTIGELQKIDRFHKVNHDVI